MARKVAGPDASGGGGARGRTRPPCACRLRGVGPVAILPTAGDRAAARWATPGRATRAPPASPPRRRARPRANGPPTGRCLVGPRVTCPRSACLLGIAPPPPARARAPAGCDGVCRRTRIARSPGGRLRFARALGASLGTYGGHPPPRPLAFLPERPRLCRVLPRAFASAVRRAGSTAFHAHPPALRSALRALPRTPLRAHPGSRSPSGPHAGRPSGALPCGMPSDGTRRASPAATASREDAVARRRGLEARPRLLDRRLHAAPSPAHRTVGATFPSRP
jgi:hypothetical protein